MTVNRPTAPGFMFPKAHDTVPVAPTAGKVQFAPGVLVPPETKVVPSGRTSSATTLGAMAVVLFVTTKS